MKSDAEKYYSIFLNLAYIYIPLTFNITEYSEAYA